MASTPVNGTNGHVYLAERFQRPQSAPQHASPSPIVPDEPARSATEGSTSGRVDIELGRARVSLNGRDGLNVLHTIMSTLRLG